MHKFKKTASFEDILIKACMYFLDTLWVENLDEIDLSCLVKEIALILRFSIFAGNCNIHNGRHFLHFLKVVACIS